jgi:hypothetical protein
MDPIGYLSWPHIIIAPFFALALYFITENKKHRAILLMSVALFLIGSSISAAYVLNFTEPSKFLPPRQPGIGDANNYLITIFASGIILLINGIKMLIEIKNDEEKIQTNN